LIVRFGASAFEGGNMYLSPPGQEKTIRKGVGDPGLMYAVTLSGSWWSLGPVDASSYITVIGDDVYVLASRDESDANKIYKINLKTNKTEKIVNSNVSRFRIIDNKLYYVKDEDNALYSSALDGTGEMKTMPCHGLTASTATYFTQPRRKQTNLNCTRSIRTGKTLLYGHRRSPASNC
jgi:hypothetical protein